MSTALRIDTLSFSKRLKEAGADENLADAIVEGLTGADTSELATKTDIADVRTELKQEIAELKQDIADVRTDLKVDIADVKYDVKWIKIIGAAIIATLILPKITELL